MKSEMKTSFYTVKPIETDQNLHDEIMGDEGISKARPLKEILSEGRYAKFTENS